MIRRYLLFIIYAFFNKNVAIAGESPSTLFTQLEMSASYERRRDRERGLSQRQKTILIKWSFAQYKWCEICASCSFFLLASEAILLMSSLPFILSLQVGVLNEIGVLKLKLHILFSCHVTFEAQPCPLLSALSSALSRSFSAAGSLAHKD